MNKKVREHKLEEAVVGDEVYYKRESENEWRGPAKVVAASGKTVIVKHGDSLREIARVHITRIQSVGKLFLKDDNYVNQESGGTDEGDNLGRREVDAQEEENMILGCRRKEQEEDPHEGERMVV